MKIKYRGRERREAQRDRTMKKKCAGVWEGGGVIWRPLESLRDLWFKKLSQHSVVHDLKLNANSEEMDPEERTSSSYVISFQCMDEDSNPPSKFLMQYYSCLKEIQEQRWSRD